MESINTTDLCELDGSELGTKTYWDHHYTREVSNFRSHKDAGEVWFGEDSVDRVIRYVDNSEEIGHASSILDLGCGNGMFLIEMACAGYSRLLGVDYSPAGVQLARLVAQDKKVDVSFEAVDFLEASSAEEPTLPACLRCQYDVCHDKGTYDAVSLNPDRPREQRQRYLQAVLRLMRPGGLLILTSCNWTQSELAQHFCPTLTLEQVIPAPTFSFGGHTGSVVTSVVLRKPV